MISHVHPWPRRGLVLGLALATLGAACAGPAGPAGPSGAPSVVSGNPPAAVPASFAPASALPVSPSPAMTTPAGQALTTDFVRDETRGQEEFGLTKAEIIRRVDATEALIARCMAAAGFEYFPVDYATARAAMDSNSKPASLTGDEFRRQFGYGITTLFAGPTSQATMSLGKRNAQYTAGLATADRVAYERTLYGENPNATFVVALDQEDFSQVGGCTRAAIQLIFSKEEVGASFVNYQNAAGTRVDADPRVIAAYKDWAGCMRQAGYAYNTPPEITADLAARLDKVAQGVAPASLSAAARAALTALQGEERALAAVDHGCDLKYVADIRLKVETEILGPNATQP